MGTQVIATIGTSTLEVEPPDLIIYRIRGMLNASDMIALRKADGEWNEGKRYLLVLIDSREQLPSDFQTRKESMKPPIGTRNRAIATFGGDPTVRKFSDLSMRALSVLTGGFVHTRVFDDEATARQWLFSQRSFLISRQDKF